MRGNPEAMRKALNPAHIFALFPAAWFTYLLIAEKGSTTIRVTLIIAFVLLVIAGPTLLALIRHGLKRGEGELTIKDWITAKAKVEVRDPDKQEEVSSEDRRDED
jgi:hypothetical protein